MTNDRTDFRPTCPYCGETGHAVYSYKDSEIFACPKIMENTVMSYELYDGEEPLKVTGSETAKRIASEDEGYCGLEPLETGEQDPYWRDGVCKQHDERFIKRNKSTWVVTRDFVTGATKTMLRGAWAVVGFPFYFIIGGLGGAIRYALKGGKK